MAVNRLNVGATNQLLAKASSGQSTNILELQNTAGVTVAGVDASGNGVGGLAHPPTFKNLIINGAMQVAQRGTSFSGITGTTYYTADRWNTSISSFGTWTQTVENDAPTGSGFRKSLKTLCTTADASPAASDVLNIQYRIEGQNLQQIAKGTSSAKQLTASFWVKSNVTGTYIAELLDFDNTRQVSAAYSIVSSGTWEKKTITFPADTTGAFDNDNNLSLILGFYLGSGTDRTSGTLNTSWASTVNANRAVGQVNVAAATDNYWQITGVQLEVGSTATEFEFLPADVELARCQRYYFRNTPGTTYGTYAILGAQGSTSMEGSLYLPVSLRAAATSIEYANLVITNIGVDNHAVTALIIEFSGFTTIGIKATIASSLIVAGKAVMLRNNSNTAGYIAFSAEL
jgi:hypothetical protein